MLQSYVRVIEEIPERGGRGFLLGVEELHLEVPILYDLEHSKKKKSRKTS
jgi:hypothetical protein